jgi:hypothetical protein
MHQVDAIVDSEWNSLVASNQRNASQTPLNNLLLKLHYFLGSGRNKVDNFQEVRKRSLELIPELGPSFEKEKSERTEVESESNSKREGKKEQEIQLGVHGKVEDLTRAESRIVVRAYWALCFSS